MSEFDRPLFVLTKLICSELVISLSYNMPHEEVERSPHGS
jgi:hypothetical protein